MLAGRHGLTADVQATTTPVGNPTAVAIDSIGNIYIADGSLRVRKVFISGIIATIAGKCYGDAAPGQPGNQLGGNL